MFKQITIRRMSDPSVRRLMRAYNAIERELRTLERYIEQEQELQKARKEVNKIFNE